MRSPTVAAALLAIVTLLSSCGVTMPAPVSVTSCDPTAKPPPSDAVGALFFASNRLPLCIAEGRYGLSNFRGIETVYGTSVLPDGETRWRHHLSTRNEPLAWREAIARRAAAVDPVRRPLLVFIHGYNNGFEDALERGLVLSRLAPYGTPVVVASWPSRNKLVSYTYDEATIEWTTDAFETLLRDLLTVSDDITVVAHSMGNRAAMAAVLNLEREREPKAAAIRRLVLASPDVDRDWAMRSDGALDRLLKNGKRELLVYTSSADIANRASHRAHGFARLGSTDCRFDMNYARQRSGANDCHMRASTPRLALVDTGEVRSGLQRHADFVDSCAVREDLKQFLSGSALTLREPTGTDLRGAFKIDRALAERQGVLKCPRPTKAARAG